MRQPQTYTIVSGPAPGAGEFDGYTCAHCNRPRRVKAMCPPGEMPDVCHLCGDKSRPSFICELCRGKGCDPFEEKLKRMEAKQHYVAEWA